MIHAPQYAVGDLVRLVAVPAVWRQPWKNEEVNQYFSMIQDCVGGTYRVIYVGEDGRPELDVGTTAIAHDPRLTGFSVSVEPECVVLVAEAPTG
jgi:hypothetical protein